MYQLVSYPLVDSTLLPLSLSLPDSSNSGGYLIPHIFPNGTIGTDYSYSSIDLLIAGLEAVRIGISIPNLAAFFDLHRRVVSENWVTLSYTDGEHVFTYTVSEIKSIIIVDKNEGLFRLMRKNAPLTFKWTRTYSNEC